MLFYIYIYLKKYIYIYVLNILQFIKSNLSEELKKNNDKKKCDVQEVKCLLLFKPILVIQFRSFISTVTLYTVTFKEQITILFL